HLALGSLLLLNRHRLPRIAGQNERLRLHHLSGVRVLGGRLREDHGLIERDEVVPLVEPGGDSSPPDVLQFLPLHLYDKHFVLGVVHPRTGAHSLPPKPARRPHVTAIASVASDRVVLVGATWSRVASVAEGAISPVLLELLAQGRTHAPPQGLSLF